MLLEDNTVCYTSVEYQPASWKVKGLNMRVPPLRCLVQDSPGTAVMSIISRASKPGRNKFVVVKKGENYGLKRWALCVAGTTGTIWYE
jgi:hypothetical protein